VSCRLGKLDLDHHSGRDDAPLEGLEGPAFLQS
jgi:hypothetical protein